MKIFSCEEMRKTMKKILHKICSLILSVFLVCSIVPMGVSASFGLYGSCQVQADGGGTSTVKTLDYSYANNTYLSLRDMAMVMKDTDKSFSLEITNHSIALTPGSDYAPVGTENTPWESEENPDISLRRNEFEVSGQKVSYYTIIVRLPSDDYDCFMMTADLAMLLDVNVTDAGAGSLQINTQEPFRISPSALEQAGYFYGVNSALVGDAATGEIYYRYQADMPYPIASTSKLMTCLLTMDAIAAGQITLEETVTVSSAVEMLASSSDGVVPLEAGQEISVQELLLGLLLPSSNECALCLAESIAGSEEAFVRMMNQKAQELGLSQAVFYNSHGLPSYTKEPISSKRQNRMSAEDMFRLAAYLLKVYPQVTEITSLKDATLESFDFEVKNSNPLLHNLSGVTGLKTGTTNKAGACLVTSLAVDDGTMEHDLIVVVLGTEDSMERGRVSGLLARYARQSFYEGVEDAASGEPGQAAMGLPTHAEAAVDSIIRSATKR